MVFARCLEQRGKGSAQTEEEECGRDEGDKKCMNWTFCMGQDCAKKVGWYGEPCAIELGR